MSALDDMSERTRADQAIAMRFAGHSYVEIAAELGYPDAAAVHAVLPDGMTDTIELHRLAAQRKIAEQQVATRLAADRAKAEAEALAARAAEFAAIDRDIQRIEAEVDRGVRGLRRDVGERGPKFLVTSKVTSREGWARLVGTTRNGPPTVGAFRVGDYVIAADDVRWVCVADGQPGRWGVYAGALPAPHPERSDLARKAPAYRNIERLELAALRRAQQRQRELTLHGTTAGAAAAFLATYYFGPLGPLLAIPMIVGSALLAAAAMVAYLCGLERLLRWRG